MSIAEIDEVSDNQAAVGAGSTEGAGWSTELGPWSALPVDSPKWDEVEGFVSALQALAAQKIEERNSGRIALRSALEELRRDFAADLAYFEANEAAWSAESVPWNEADALAGKVGQLRAQLEARRPLLERQGASYSETRRIRSEIDSVEETISSHLADLGALFAEKGTSPPFDLGRAAGPQTTVTTEPAVETTEIEEPAATSEAVSAGIDFGEQLSVTDDGPAAAADEIEYPQGMVELPDFDVSTPVEPAEPEVKADDTVSPVEDNFAGEAFRNGASTSSAVEPLPLSATATVAPVDAAVRTRGGGSLRRLIDRDHDRYSPLTGSQERTILTSGPGVGLILASSIMGFEQLPEAVSSLAETVLDDRGATTTIPASISSGEEVREWLGQFASRNPDVERLVACQAVVMPSQDVAERVEGAIRFCEEEGHPSTRVLFFFGPAASWLWLNLPDDKWEEMAGRIHPRFALRPWTEEAIKVRLESRGLPSGPESCGMAIDSTGGWYWCVDKLFERCQEGVDFDSAAARLGEEFRKDGDLHDELLMRLGVRADTVADTVLKQVLQNGSVSEESITPESIGGDVTADECRAAVELLKAMCCLEGDGVVHVTPFLARALQDG